jgi:hypothetical protein
MQSDDSTSTPQEQQPTATPGKTHRDRPNLMGGVVLILLGAMFLAANFIPNVRFHDLWPLLLIGIGAVLLWNSRARKPQ